MGNQSGQVPKKLIQFQNLTKQISKCQQMGQKQCSIYGTLHRIAYEGIQYNIGKCSGNQTPDSTSLHHLVHPNILLIPPHILIQNFKLSKYQKKKQLLQLILKISELATTVDIGFSHNRIAYSQLTKKWCIVGDPGNGLWNYQALVKNPVNNGIYLSPQLMKALSKDKLYPKVDVKQSDIFIFAVILLEIIFQEELQTQVYNFATYQIKLGPILEKLLGVQQIFGKEVYQLFVKMLEFQPQARITFDQLKKQIQKILSVKSGDSYLNPMNCITPPANTKPKIDSFTPSPQPPTKSHVQEHSRGRSPGAIRKNLLLTDRQTGKNSFSPIKNTSQQAQISVEAEDNRNSLIYQDRKKRISNGAKITPNRTKVWQGMQNQRPKVEPFGLRLDNKNKESQQNSQRQEKNKSFSKLRTIRS